MNPLELNEKSNGKESKFILDSLEDMVDNNDYEYFLYFLDLVYLNNLMDEIELKKYIDLLDNNKAINNFDETSRYIYNELYSKIYGNEEQSNVNSVNAKEFSDCILLKSEEGVMYISSIYYYILEEIEIIDDNIYR